MTFPPVLSLVRGKPKLFRPSVLPNLKKSWICFIYSHSSPQVFTGPEQMYWFVPVLDSPSKPASSLGMNFFFLGLRPFLLRFSLASHQSQWQLERSPYSGPLVYQCGKDILWGSEGEVWGR